MKGDTQKTEPEIRGSTTRFFLTKLKIHPTDFSQKKIIPQTNRTQTWIIRLQGRVMGGS
jgi:hypothetical protein